MYNICDFGGLIVKRSRSFSVLNLKDPTQNQCTIPQLIELSISEKEDYRVITIKTIIHLQRKHFFKLLNTHRLQLCEACSRVLGTMEDRIDVTLLQYFEVNPNNKSHWVEVLSTFRFTNNIFGWSIRKYCGLTELIRRIILMSNIGMDASLILHTT